MKEIDSVVVIGRRWFDRRNGNTYNTCRIYVDGVLVVQLDRAYGYDDHYVTRAEEWLENDGRMPGRNHYPSGGSEPGWQYFRDRNIAFAYEAADVARRKDL